jgi:DNA-binding XRE family transcriptional regulator
MSGRTKERRIKKTARRKKRIKKGAKAAEQKLMYFMPVDDDRRVFSIPQAKEEKLLKVLKKADVTFELLEECIPAEKVHARQVAKYGKPSLILRGARVREGLTQKQLADRLEIEISNLSAMENDRRAIGKNMAKKLGDILNIDYRMLL